VRFLFVRTRKSKRKNRRFTSGKQRSSLGDFVRIKLLTRASVENPVLNQATVHLLAGWQITALLATIPNAGRTLIDRGRITSKFNQWSSATNSTSACDLPGTSRRQMSTCAGAKQKAATR